MDNNSYIDKIDKSTARNKYLWYMFFRTQLHRALHQLITVPPFAKSQPVDRHICICTNQLGNAFIQFEDGSLIEKS